jgi:hypothetical protein
MSNDNKKKTKYLQSEVYVDYDCDKLYVTIIEIVDDVPQGSHMIFVPHWHKCVSEIKFYIEVFLN